MVKAVHLSYEQTSVALATGAANLPNQAPAGSKSIEVMLAILSLVAASGWFIAHRIYYLHPGTADRLAQRMRSLYALIANKYWVDEFYGTVVVAPVLFLARGCWACSSIAASSTAAALAAGYSAQGVGALVARIQSGQHSLLCRMAGPVRRAAAGGYRTLDGLRSLCRAREGRGRELC